MLERISLFAIEVTIEFHALEAHALLRDQGAGRRISIGHVLPS
jgi:hypothetical protein